ncbi:Pseudoazurin precursor (Cupredoxin) (Blue copper protein) [Methylophaga frappieri]|uniref:Pseudoazurin (Cupredoxin) (Blue copper protein) n=1 Tax=Methylophaga frappieri (strain ATCC BAA-2434 / DSM 25690 / JAM7) TaxID=754477 RepID=I1YKB0_METFJ|nr:plastocyanin/azurin family copper-binding protein [Methylophaga frappieri]AFJ03353.1 Pseudoazurin precursor (Cupredoxin) (Blue copper protein) [Methylophaga frappieri]
MKFAKTMAGILMGTSAMFSAATMAETHVVNASLTSFDPLVIKIQPGDTVKWDRMNGHLVNTKFTDSKGVTEYLPEGAEGFMSQMGENFETQPLTVEGVYLYKCDPHWGAGMGGAIIVGEPTNLQAIVDSKPKGALKRLVKKTQKAVE